LSNFSQTDKQAQQWFLLLPDGHEGPYSIIQLEQRVSEGLSLECSVWKQGEEETHQLKDLLLPDMPVDDGPPALPPIPDVELNDLPPDLPLEDLTYEPVVEVSIKSSSQNMIRLVVGVSFILCLLFGAKYLLDKPGQVSWSRPQKMTLDSYQVLSDKLVLNDWDQPLFFNEATSPDYSRFWLVTPQFYNCDIAGDFTAVEGDILTIDDIKTIKFNSKSKLIDHVAEFNKIEFEEGVKLLPGFYKMNLKLTNCEASTLKSKLAGLFHTIPSEIDLSYRIAISAQKAEYLSIALKKLAEEKIKIEERKRLNSDQFWQDVQQKYQTLLAVCLQIEQGFLDILNTKKDWRTSLRTGIDKYTKSFGALLTNFVISNEADFKKLRDDKVNNLSIKTGYESKIKSLTTNMGQKSMTFIENWQKLSVKSANSQREKLKKEVRTTFSAIKKDIEKKIIDVTEEQAKLAE